MERTGSADSRGVSPVFATILLVAIVVILATIIGGTTFDIARDATESVPQATFEIQYNDSNITVMHTHGDRIDPTQLSIAGKDPDGQVTFGTWAELASDDEVEPGATLVLEDASGNEEFRIVWNSKTGKLSHTLDRWPTDSSADVAG